MKRWWTTVVRDYLTFTKKDRIGIVALIALGALIYFSPRLFRAAPKPVDKDSFAQELTRLKITVDSNHQYKRYKNSSDDDEAYQYDRPSYPSYNKTAKGELFEFDPNTIDANGWKRLGLRDKTIETIEKFRSKGFKFKQPEDIKRIYGLHENEADRLIPFIRIANGAADNKTASSSPVAPTPSSVGKPAYKPRVIDVNTADTSAFISLPGIGGKLAARIVNFRDKLGGFTSVQQVGETYGVPDFTFQKIKPLLQCSRNNIRTFDINEAEASDLKNHPYIRWNIANAIVNYRKQHGRYNSLDDLKKIDIITDDLFNKIAPYLKVLGQ